MNVRVEYLVIIGIFVVSTVISEQSSSGVTVSAEAKTVYDELKKEKKYRYIIYHVKDGIEIDVESTGAREETYSDFLKVLQDHKDECRYVVFDFPANIPVEGAQEKSSMSVDRLVLIRWAPQSATITQKMLYSGSRDAVKKALVGIYKYVLASDIEEASQEAIEDAFRNGGKARK